MTPRRHSFSIEMRSKDHIQNICVNNAPNGNVIFEGELGELVSIELVEGILLQISGVHGTVRIDISEDELRHGLKSKK